MRRYKYYYSIWNNRFCYSITSLLFFCMLLLSSFSIFRRNGGVHKYQVLSMSTTTTTTTATSKRNMKSRIAAIAQLRSTSNKYSNLRNVAICAKLAKQQNAQMLFLPECFGFLGENSDQTFDNAEDPVALDDNNNKNNVKNSESITKSLIDTLRNNNNNDNDEELSTTTKTTNRIHLLDGLKTIAKETGLWISAGGMHELGAEPEPNSGNPRIYNTHLVLDCQGTIQAIYRKIHLFDVSIPGKVELRESKTTAPGKDLVVCDSPIGKLGLSTCYDVRFPEQYVRLCKDFGAEILLVPSAFTVPTGVAHWHTLLKARAIENQCYVLASAQYGKHNTKRESFGHTLAIDPWGTILADAGGYPLLNEEENVKGRQEVVPEEPPSIITCEIDLDYIKSIRQRMPIDMHRSNAPISL